MFSQKVVTLRRVFEGHVPKGTCFFDGGTSGEPQGGNIVLTLLRVFKDLSSNIDIWLEVCTKGSNFTTCV